MITYNTIICFFFFFSTVWQDSTVNYCTRRFLAILSLHTVYLRTKQNTWNSFSFSCLFLMFFFTLTPFFCILSSHQPAFSDLLYFIFLNNCTSSKKTHTHKLFCPCIHQRWKHNCCKGQKALCFITRSFAPQKTQEPCHVWRPRPNSTRQFVCGQIWERRHDKCPGIKIFTRNLDYLCKGAKYLLEWKHKGWRE